MSVARAQREISSAEFSEWLAYYQVEPFGEERADLRAAIIASTQASTMTNKRFKPAEFMPEYGPKARKSPAQIRDLLRIYLETAKHGHHQ